MRKGGRGGAGGCGGVGRRASGVISHGVEAQGSDTMLKQRMKALVENNERFIVLYFYLMYFSIVRLHIYR